MKDTILYLDSPLKDKTYGGHMIYDQFNLGDDPDRKVGEYWAISAHDNGLSVIKNGHLKGKTLKEVFHLHRELFADSKEERFPLLVKINELNGAASVQVHPNDQYCKVHCNDLGKAEFCLYLDVEPASKLIRGHTAKTKQAFKEMAEANEWDQLICKKDLKNDDFVYTPPGIIHGGEGHILMAEVQQSSDVTFRIYDYDNTDEHGNSRQTHLEKAIEVATIPHQEPKVTAVKSKQGINEIITYINNEFFSVTRYYVKDKVVIQNNQYSLCLVLSGKGKVISEDKTGAIEKGNAFILTSNCKEYAFEGNLEVLVSEPPCKENNDVL